MGEEDSSVRNSEVTEMLDYAYAQYEIEQVLSKNSVLDEIKISKGKKQIVEVVPMEEITYLNKKTDKKKNNTFELNLYDVTAPVKVGDKVGELIIKDDTNERKVDVTVKEDVEKANIFVTFIRNLGQILTGNIN